MITFRSLTCQRCDVKWLSFMQILQYGMDSIVEVSFRLMSSDSIAATRSAVLMKDSG